MAGQIHAVYCPRAAVVRVWCGCGGQSEDFTLDEVRRLCVAGDRELMVGKGAASQVSLWFSCDDERGRAVEMVVGRRWLVDFLRAVRGAYRSVRVARDLTTEIDAELTDEIAA